MHNTTNIPANYKTVNQSKKVQRHLLQGNCTVTGFDAGIATLVMLRQAAHENA
jgi:hypothetical protein